MLLPLKSIGLLACAATLLPFHSVAGQGNFNLPPDTYYPKSPEVYPSPNMTGWGWEQAYEKAKQFRSMLTLDEKAQIVTGNGVLQPCVGNVLPIERLGFRGLCLSDSDLGIGNTHTYASGFAPGISVSSTWNKILMRTNAFLMGQEFRQKGVNVVLGPVATIGRYAGGGTNFEGYGADPYLNGVNVAEYVKGVQAAGVQANMKQYVGYDSQQYYRGNYSSNIDDKTMHEIEVWPYAEGIKAGCASAMCSYNLVNNTWACQNSKTINGILKGELGFQGYLLTDWYALQSGVLAASAGLDMDMPGTNSANTFSFFGKNLTVAVENGTLSINRLNDMVDRVMTPYYYLGQDQDYPFLNYHDGPFENVVNVRSHTHDELIHKVAVEQTVLLVNRNSTLPLHRPRRLAIFGIDAGPNPYGADPAFIELADPQMGAGTLTNGFGSGTTQYPFVIDPLAALQRRTQYDLTKLDWALNESFVPQIISKASRASHCIAFIQSLSSEELDRNLTAWHGGDEMVLNVADNCKNTIVVIHAVGPVVMDTWINHPNVSAVVWGGLPGQASGDALVDILYGHENPSGKLPYTILKHESDYYAKKITQPKPYPQINYTEGVWTDYRYYKAHNISMQFPFGFGLSYTSFGYSALNITNRKANPFAGMNESVSYLADAPGGDKRLFETVVTLTVNITNTGSYHGREIAQLYLGFPQSAEEPNGGILRGFEDISLDPGEMGMVRFDLRRKDVSYWDVVRQRWEVADGSYTVYIGASSTDFKLEGTFEL
ncbi:MAG: hypothetical protein M1834_007813 [Cirrosporium novae-zelandiae]|nr:MAG: hypothetical protein M1834_007813 [Cirrosporium novae-zelandiae]